MCGFPFCLHLWLSTEREGTHLSLPWPGVTCPREEQRPGPCSEAETPSTALMTKISQEGETSPGAAPKRHLNDAYTQDLSAKTDGHFISRTHWQFCKGQVIKTACGHTVCFLSSLAGKAMSMGHTSLAFSSSFWEFSSSWLQPFQTIHLICLMPSW